MIVARLVQPRQQMIGARPRRSGTYPEPAADLGLAGGGKRRALLVANSDPRQSLVAPPRVGKRIERIPYNAKNLTDSHFRECRG